MNDYQCRVLGQDASKIISIINELGNQRSIKVRLRGIGSGFREGPGHQELPEPMHFNVSAEDEMLLRKVVERVTQHVETAKAELAGGY